MSETKIENIEFLTPAKVITSCDGKTSSIVVNIDLINKRAYDSKGLSDLTRKIFEYLEDTTVLPEDFFKAPDELSEQATEQLEKQNNG